jgi:hypothetical protein
MAEQPDFTAAANGLAIAATQIQKMQNLPVINVAAQLNRMEERMLRMEERMLRMEERILREFRGLRADFTRAYANITSSVYL